MGLCGRLTLIIITILIAVIASKFYGISEPALRPEIDVNEYWGPGSATDYVADSKPVQQTIAYNEQTIEALRQKLNDSVQFHPSLENTGFQYGMNPNVLVEFIDYWRDNYLPRWREREAFFNTLPHYLVNFQGLDIHYIHTKATYDTNNKKAYPLLLIHGWPGSVREFYEIIPKLALPGDELDIVFEVVAPSLPGFGWSDGATRTGMGVVKMAVILRNLMLKLGYDKFYIQGGDWGSALGSAISTLFPENVIGYHSNMCMAETPTGYLKAFISSFFPTYFVDEKYVDFVFPRLKRLEQTIIESGYMHIQATKPDTIGAALTANPIGLAAYILEKFSTWTDPRYRLREDGGFSNEDFTKDALIDNLMVYYLTGSITTSMRIYAETFAYANRNLPVNTDPTDVPTGCARFKNDLMHQTDWELKGKFTNLIHSTWYPFGGHFIAMERPNDLYSDFVEFVKKVRILN